MRRLSSFERLLIILITAILLGLLIGQVFCPAIRKISKETQKIEIISQLQEVSDENMAIC